MWSQGFYTRRTSRWVQVSSRRHPRGAGYCTFPQFQWLPSSRAPQGMSALRISDKMASTSHMCWPDLKKRSKWINECVQASNWEWLCEWMNKWTNACCLYLDLYSKRRDACVFSTPYNHFLQQVPLVISANWTLIRPKLSDGHVFSCMWSHSSGWAWALKRLLNPTGHRTTNLKKIKLCFNNNIQFKTEKLHLNTVKIQN